MKKSKFKKGDWCFCEFKLQKIESVENNKITSVSDGSFVHSGSDLSDRCFPLDMNVKMFSDEVSHWQNEFDKLNTCVNYPALNNALIQKWIELCLNSHNPKKVKELIKNLTSFGKEVIKSAKQLSRLEVQGVQIFHR